MKWESRSARTHRKLKEPLEALVVALKAEAERLQKKAEDLKERAARG
jgi:hypothetical protein